MLDAHNKALYTRTAHEHNYMRTSILTKKKKINVCIIMIGHISKHKMHFTENSQQKDANHSY